jgi:hypothetical protein
VDFPKIELADYERRLRSLQETLQLVKQAYLGTPECPMIVLEGWEDGTPQAEAGSLGFWDGHWILAASKSIPLPRPHPGSRFNIISSGPGINWRNKARS